MIKLLLTYIILFVTILINDGNKRTGFGATLLFLKANNIPIKFDKKEYEDLVAEVAKGKKTKEEIAQFLENGQ